MKVRILSCAEREAAEAVDYYNLERRGLGFEFAAEVKRTLDRIRFCPDAWPPFSRRTRRCILNRFPYGILYQRRKDEILVIGIIHMKRDPLRWAERLKEVFGDENAAPDS
jgi:hypothetical protein